MNLTKFCFDFASLYKFGESHIGKVLAPLLAFPLLFLFKIVYEWDKAFFSWLCLILGVLLFVVINFALKFNSEQGSSAIVWDKIIGIMIAFIAIPLRIKLMIFGYLLFFIIQISRHSLFGTYLSEKLDGFPGVFGLFATDIFTGVIVNVFLRFILWIAF